MSENEPDAPAEAGARDARQEPCVRNGKIARLPHAIRMELNQRIKDGEMSPTLLAWLNGVPGVKKVMSDHFAGVELTENNLSRWRQGGYKDWLAEEQTRGAVVALRGQGAALNPASVKALAEDIRVVMVSRLAVELHRLQSVENDEARFRCFRDLMWGFIFLRREEEQVERLQREDRRKAGFLLAEERYWFIFPD